MRDLEMTPQTAGLLGSLTLAASAAGGMVFGVLADRWGRTRALSLSILIYSVFTAACGFAQNVTQLAIFRVFLGIGLGGEWASGAALVSETWPAAASRQGARPDAVLLGDRLRRRGHRHGAGPAALRLARRVLRRRAAGAVHAVDSPQRARARDLAATRRAQRRARAGGRLSHRLAPRDDRRHHADERGDDVRVVGIESVDPRLSVAAGRRRAASASRRW